MESLQKIGDVPTYEGIEVMREYGIDLSRHRATNIRNSNNVISMYPELKEKVYTMKEYARISTK